MACRRGLSIERQRAAALRAAETAIVKHDAITGDAAFAALGIQKAELCVQATVIAENLAMAEDPRAERWDRIRRDECAAVVG